MEAIKNLIQEIFQNKIKRYIVNGIISAIIIIPLIIILAVGEPDYIRPDCSGYCKKPYNIKVYSDSKISSQLEKCKYKKNSELFKFVLEAVKTHNILRACHNAQPLLPNCEIMKISQDYAESEQSGHSGTRFHGEWMGENLYGSYNIKLNGSYPVKRWYDEISDYDFNTHKSSNGGVTGHFTQVVWKNTKEIGNWILLSRSFM